MSNDEQEQPFVFDRESVWAALNRPLQPVVWVVHPDDIEMIIEAFGLST